MGSTSSLNPGQGSALRYLLLRILFVSLLLKDQSFLRSMIPWKMPEHEVMKCVTGGSKIRFYAGVPIVNPEGYVLGSLCVMDVVPGALDEQQKEALKILADQVMTHLEVKYQNRVLNDLIQKYEEISTMFNSSAELHCILDRNGTIELMNNIVERLARLLNGRGYWSFNLGILL
jgi:hypothetical protein